MRMAISLCLLLSPALAAAAQPDVKVLSAAELRHAIETAPEEQPGKPGLYFLRLSPESEHPVLGIRRTAPGKSEVHADFTDVWYVIKGAGTLVTGGSVSEGTEILRGEIRGAGIKDGSSRHIQEGEFAVIPSGIPHWISEIDGEEILYLVVKIPSKK